MPPDGLVDLRTEQPTDGGRETQGGEVGAGDLHPLNAEGPPPVRHVGAEAAVRNDVGEDRLVPPEVAEHRVAEDHAAPARPVATARARSALGSGGFEVDQPFGLDDRQRTQHELAVKGEDRRVGPDAEGQRHDRHARDDRGLEEHSQGQSHVLHHLLQLVGKAHAARPPAVVLGALDAAELHPRAARGFAPRHPGAHQLVGAGFQVKPHLFVEHVFEAVPPGPRGEERAQAREHVTPPRRWPGGRRPWPRRAVPSPPSRPRAAAARRRSAGSTWRGAGSRSRPIPTR